MKINMHNVGDLVLSDSGLRKLLPSLSHLFDSWRLGMQFAPLRPTARKAALDMLESLRGDALEILADHFGEAVVVEKLDYRIVKNLKVPVGELEFSLGGYEGFQPCITTEGDVASVTFWR